MEATKSTQNRDRGVSYTRPIDAAKHGIPVIDLADRLAGPCKMRRVGKTWTTNCPLPDHEDKTPSFVVYLETNSWHCFGCLRRGDVVDLYRMAHPHRYSEGQVREAAADLLLDFGHEIPPRPPSWFSKQQRQKEMRRTIDDARVEVLARRLWKYVFEPIIAEIEDSAERVEMADRLWRAALPRAAQLLEDRDPGRAA